MCIINIVNISGSGYLGVELDLEQLSKDFDDSIASYDPETYPGMYLRFGDHSPLITVYRTGKYIITGSKSDERIHSTRIEFLNSLSDRGIIENSTDEWFSMQNYVCTSDLNKSQDLNALAIELGLEQTEYEPEQFSGLVFRPPSLNCVILIFTSGKVVITGCRSVEDAESALNLLKRNLRSVN